MPLLGTRGCSRGGPFSQECLQQCLLGCGWYITVGLLEKATCPREMYECAGWLLHAGCSDRFRQCLFGRWQEFATVKSELLQC